MRSPFHALLLFAAAVFAAPILHAQGYPARPVRFLVGYPPGGATDINARIVAQKLSETWGQQVVVENRPGASGTIAAELVARAAPDGYALLVAPQTSVVAAPLILRKVNFDTFKDFAALSIMGSTPLLLVVHPSLPPRGFGEFTAFLKANAANLSYASGGIGATQHFAMELLSLSLGVKLVHVPYKGENPAIADILGGEIPFMFSNISAVLPFVKSGRVRALAISSPKRSPLAPEYPTVAESGMPGFDVATWSGLYAPSAIARDLGARISAEVARVLRLPDVKERMIGQGIDPVGSTPGEHLAYLKSEFARTARVAKEANIRAD
ncbi:MAG: tripartite tricarboxylate transporter substrate binding protein [Burkholderiales bacterium]|nr:tripartite tricarboxylate transporter substrate binding protein [Burkholderiales bacterium]